MSRLLPPLFLHKENSELGIFDESENAFSPDFDWLRIFIFIEAKKKYMVHHDYVHSLMPIYV